MGCFRTVFGHETGLSLTIWMSKGYIKNMVPDSVETITNAYNNVPESDYRYLTTLLHRYRAFISISSPTVIVNGKRRPRFGRIVWMISEWVKQRELDLIPEEVLVGGYQKVTFYCSGVPRPRTLVGDEELKVKSKDIRKKVSGINQIPIQFVGSRAVDIFRSKVKLETFESLSYRIAEEVDEIIHGCDTIPKTEVKRIIKTIRDKYINIKIARNSKDLQDKVIYGRLSCIDGEVTGRSRQIVCIIKKKAA